jgi:lipase chaperone LimK
MCGAAALVAVLVGAHASPRRAPARADGAAGAASAHATRADVPRPAIPPLRPAPPPASPSSLDGTEVDGALAVDAAGDLILSEDVRRFFDYFLTSVGEEPLATVRARIDSALIARLPPRAAAQATALLARYLDYREAARGLRLDDDLDARIAAVRALRRDRLGADAATKLFAEADAADDAALRRRRVLAETEPGGAERARGLAEVDAQLPDRLRAAARATTAPLAALRHEEELRARGAGEEEVTAARAAAFGPDGAARLEALDRQRAAFRARVDAFRAERARLGPDDARRLLEQMFTPAERVRVDALDRLGR